MRKLVEVSQNGIGTIEIKKLAKLENQRSVGQIATTYKRKRGTVEANRPNKK